MAYQTLITAIVLFIPLFNIVRYIYKWIKNLYHEQKYEYKKGERNHYWVKDEPAYSHTCNVCKTLLVSGVDNILKCEYCGSMCHSHCIHKIDYDCKVLVSKKEDFHHQWRQSNAEIGACCSYCSQEITDVYGLDSVSCCYCQRIVHKDCCEAHKDEICDMGELNSLVLPPYCVQTWTTYQLSRQNSVHDNSSNMINNEESSLSSIIRKVYMDLKKTTSKDKKNKHSSKHKNESNKYLDNNESINDTVINDSTSISSSISTEDHSESKNHPFLNLSAQSVDSTVSSPSTVSVLNSPDSKRIDTELSNTVKELFNIVETIPSQGKDIVDLEEFRQTLLQMSKELDSSIIRYNKHQSKTNSNQSSPLSSPIQTYQLSSDSSKKSRRMSIRYKNAETLQSRSHTPPPLTLSSLPIQTHAFLTPTEDTTTIHTLEVNSNNNTTTTNNNNTNCNNTKNNNNNCNNNNSLSINSDILSSSLTPTNSYFTNSEIGHSYIGRKRVESYSPSDFYPLQELNTNFMNNKSDIMIKPTKLSLPVTPEEIENNEELNKSVDVKNYEETKIVEHENSKISLNTKDNETIESNPLLLLPNESSTSILNNENSDINSNSVDSSESMNVKQSNNNDNNDDNTNNNDNTNSNDNTNNNDNNDKSHKTIHRMSLQESFKTLSTLFSSPSSPVDNNNESSHNNNLFSPKASQTLNSIYDNGLKLSHDLTYIAKQVYSDFQHNYKNRAKETLLNLQKGLNLPDSLYKEKNYPPDRRTWVINTNEDIDPLLVFINPKSGGLWGKLLLPIFRLYLHPIQVVNLSLGGPQKALQNFKNCKKFRILVCGGDGSVGWVLSEVEKMKFTNPPPVAILPLGTGNDLSRTLHWGPGYKGNVSIVDILKSIERSHVTFLDRWTVNIVENESKKIKDLPLNCYFGIGVDADVALQFHEMRNRNPTLFESQLFNKVFYTLIGSRKSIISRSSTLDEYIDLYIDNKKCSLANIEGLVVLNIPCYAGGGIPWNNQFKQNIRDGLIEIIGFTNLVHCATMKVGLSSAHTLGQGKSIHIVLKETNSMQIDGEPWMQLPCDIHITYRGTQQMLSKAQDLFEQTSGIVFDVLRTALANKVIDDQQFSYLNTQMLKQIDSSSL